MGSKCWIVVFDSGDYLCIESGEFIKKNLLEIDPKSLFQFWSENHEDLLRYWREHGDEKMDPKEMNLIEANWNNDGELIF